MTTQQSFQKIIENLKKPLKIDEFKSLSSTYTVIDTRLEAQTTGLIKGSYWFAGQALHCSWLPTFICPHQPYLCVCDRSELNEVLELFVLMGYMNCMGYNNFEMKHYDGQMEYPILRNWAELGDTQRKQFLDVRTPFQWNKTGVPKKAMLIELEKLDKESQEKLNMLREIQKNKLLVVNCKSGQRTKLASSILFRHGIYNVLLIEDVDDFPKIGIKMQTVEDNEKYWAEKKDRLNEISSEEENKIEKQIQSDNMNRMAVQECYEECLKKNPEKSQEECRQVCSNKQQTKKPEETIKFQHSFNRNQFQARKQHIIPSKTKSTQQRSHKESSDSQLYKKALSSFSTQNYNDALNVLNQLIAKNPQNVQTYINRSLCQAKLGHNQSAYGDLQKAIEIDHMNFVAYFDLASLKLNQNQNQSSKLNALQNLKKSLSCLYMTKCRRTKDQHDVDKAMDLNPQNIEALMMKGLKLCESGNFQESLRLLQRVNNITGSQDKQIHLLYDKLKQKIEQSKIEQIQVNPEVEKPQTEQLKTGVNIAKPTESGNKDVDEEISEKIKQWNRLYKEIYGDEASRVRRLKGDTESSHHTVWIMN